jgi:hypothetical protein
MDELAVVRTDAPRTKTNALAGGAVAPVPPEGVAKNTLPSHFRRKLPEGVAENSVW